MSFEKQTFNNEYPRVDEKEYVEYVKSVDKSNVQHSKRFVEELLSNEDISGIVKDMNLKPDKPESKECLGLQLYTAKYAFLDVVMDKMASKFFMVKADSDGQLGKYLREAFDGIFQVQSIDGNPNEVCLHIEFESRQQKVGISEVEAFRPFVIKKELVPISFEYKSTVVQEPHPLSFEDALVEQSFADYYST